MTKVEQYKKSRRLPSNSQALAAMTEEIEKGDAKVKSLLKLIRDLLSRMTEMIEQAKNGGSKAYEHLVKGIADLLQVLLQNVLSQLRQK